MHAEFANPMGSLHRNKSSSLLSRMAEDENEKQRDESQQVWSDETKRVKNHKPVRIPPPPSPESPWNLSPLRTPSPHLYYHCIASLHRGEGNIYSIAVSKGVVFTASDSCRIRAWKQPDCMDRGHFKAAAGGVKAIATSGNMLFTSHRDLRIRVWSFTVAEKLNWKKLCSIPKRSSFLSLSKSKIEGSSHKDTISCIAYYHPQNLLYTASHDKTVKVWRISDRKCVDSFLAHEQKVNSLTVNQNDGCLFTCSSDATVKIWRRLFPENSHTLTMTLKFQTSPVNSIVLSTHHDATFLYSGSSDGTINFWEKEKVSFRYNHGGFLQGHRFGVLCLAVVERLVLSGSEDTTVRIWRREEGSWCHECLAVLDGHRGPVRCLAGTLETMDNRIMDKMETSVLVYSGSLDQTFKVWRVKVLLGHDDQDKKRLLEYEEEDGNLKMKKKFYEMSPVLSPSWVQKKLQPNYF